jgi:hypothetical protein
MNHKILLSITFLFVAVLANGAIAPIYADGGDSPDSDWFSFTTSESNQLSASVTGSGRSATKDYIDNPWGCEAVSHWPHESKRIPGPGYIQAKSETNCDVAPPAGSRWTVKQTLYRSSWSGWRQVETKYSICPTANQGPYSTTCNPTWMRAYINWRCQKGTFYNYRVEADHALIVPSDLTYKHSSSAQNAQYWQRGKIECTR